MEGMEDAQSGRRSPAEAAAASVALMRIDIDSEYLVVR